MPAKRGKTDLNPKAMYKFFLMPYNSMQNKSYGDKTLANLMVSSQDTMHFSHLFTLNRFYDKMAVV